MIFASKKVIFIVLFQLLVVIINEVNSSPTAVASISSIGTNIANGAKNLLNEVNDLYTKTKNSVTRLIDNVTGTAASAVSPMKRKIKRHSNCFGLSYIFNKTISVFFTDNTTQSSVKFYFASPSQPNYTTVIIQNNTFSLNNVSFDPYRPTVLISHGFMSSGKEQWLEDMKNAFLKYNAANVIVVDWEKGSNTWNYIGAAVSTQVVGDEVAKLFDYIYDQKIRNKTDLDKLGKIHFVGHSLGAHIVARAANKIKENQIHQKRHKNWIVERITGLDPAQPCFIMVEKNRRLDESDAEHVDVIHTNARHVLLMGLGLVKRIGYFDFYPNGGQMQPGCSEYEESIWSYFVTPSKMVNATICSHGRAYQLFTESIVEAINGHCSFNSHPWNRQYTQSFDKLMDTTCKDDDCPQMGINAFNYFPRSKGIYFTPTGHKQPYCVVEESDKKLIQDQLKHDATLEKAVETLGK